MGVLVQDGRMLREGIVESAATCLFYRRTNGDRDGVFTNTYLQYLHPPHAHLQPLSPKPMTSTRRSPSLWPDCVNGATVIGQLIADCVHA